MSLKNSLENAEDNWLISYADMMTLLLFLFIILYAMAVQKEGANQISAASAAPAASASSQAADQSSTGETAAYYYIDKNSSAAGAASKSSSSSKSAAAKTAAGKSTASKSSSTKKVSTAAKSSTGKSSTGKKPTYNEVESFVESNSLKGTVSVQQVETGIVFDIQAEVLFDEGSSQLRPESYTVLDKIGKYIGSLSNDIIIAGHTDNQPVDTGNYQSNWELSCDRATKVLRYFTDTEKLAPQRFQAVGYGGYRPIADNGTASGRQQNRRVEVIVVEVP